MAWIKSHTVLLRHRKILALAASLKIKPVQALGHVHALWHAALEQQEDGDLSGWSWDQIAQGAAWEGSRKILVNAMNKTKLLDEHLQIHDWWDHVGNYLSIKYKNYPEKLQKIRNTCLGNPKGALRDILREPLGSENTHTNNPIRYHSIDPIDKTDRPDAVGQANASGIEGNGNGPAKADVCDFKYKDGTKCTWPKEERAFFCREHIEKFREIKIARSAGSGGDSGGLTSIKDIIGQ